MRKQVQKLLIVCTALLCVLPSYVYATPTEQQDMKTLLSFCDGFKDDEITIEEAENIVQARLSVVGKDKNDTKSLSQKLKAEFEAKNFNDYMHAIIDLQIIEARSEMNHRVLTHHFLGLYNWLTKKQSLKAYCYFASNLETNESNALLLKITDIIFLNKNAMLFPHKIKVAFVNYVKKTSNNTTIMYRLANIYSKNIISNDPYENHNNALKILNKLDGIIPTKRKSTLYKLLYKVDFKNRKTHQENFHKHFSYICKDIEYMLNWELRYDPNKIYYNICFDKL